MMTQTELIEIFKALSNKTRLNILAWLKNPSENFPPQGCHLEGEVDLKGGVCVGSIQEKAGLSQSTISSYLDMLLKAGLLKAQRHGKWTYYSRNEEMIKRLAAYTITEI